MPQELENKIRERAYHLWVADGCRDGESERHWLAAEREVLAAFVSTAPAPASKGRSRSAANAGVGALPKSTREGAPPRLGPFSIVGWAKLPRDSRAAWLRYIHCPLPARHRRILVTTLNRSSAPLICDRIFL